VIGSVDGSLTYAGIDSAADTIPAPPPSVAMQDLTDALLALREHEARRLATLWAWRLGVASGVDPEPWLSAAYAWLDGLGSSLELAEAYVGALRAAVVADTWEQCGALMACAHASRTCDYSAAIGALECYGDLDAAQRDIAFVRDGIL